MDSLFGKVIDGRYEIKALPVEPGTEAPYLGQGGMGKVYLAYDSKLQTERAIKFLTFDGPPAFAAAVTERFRREAIVAARLGTHQNVVAVYDHVEAHDGIPAYIVMELARGQAFSKLLQEVKPLDPDRAVNLAIGICNGIGAAHRQQIVHRDVKPKNVIVCQTSTGELAKVIDFGIAKTEEVDWTQLTRFGDKMGTYAYMSPEQWFDPSIVGVRADVYSLGCLLYEALAGRPVFEVQTPEEYPEKHRVEKPAKFAKALGIPAPVETVVLRALAKAPADRQQDANQLAVELADALASVADSKRKEKQRKEKSDVDKLRAEVEQHRLAAEDAARKLAEQEQLVLDERRTFYATIAELRAKLASTPIQSRPQQPVPAVVPPPVQSQPVQPPVQPLPVQPPAVPPSVPAPVPAVQRTDFRIVLRRVLAPTAVGLLAGLLIEILLKVVVGWGVSLASLSAVSLGLLGFFTLAAIGIGVFLWIRAGAKTTGGSLALAGLQVVVFAVVGFLLVTMAMDGLSEWQVAQGMKYYAQHRLDEAISNYGTAMQLNPHNARAYISRGAARLEKNQYAAAVADYDEAIRIDSGQAAAYSGRCRVAFTQGGYSRALADCNLALNLDAKDASAYKNRGDVFVALAQYDRAITDYNEAMRLDPGQSDLYLAALKRVRDAKTAAGK